MYSAYVQSMALMYHYLFDDAKYATEGALTMRLSRCFGAPTPAFSHDERKLNEHVYWTMVQKGYLESPVSRIAYSRSAIRCRSASAARHDLRR
jgi:hypothetical protein